jgi:hypothetical protein
MSPAPETVIAFSGAVECRREPLDPLGLTLIGRVADGSGEIAHLCLMGPPPPGLPLQVQAAEVQHLGENQYRISAPGGQWIVTAARSYLHRDVSARFHAAVPPRAAPWSKRLFWWAVLRAAASPLGRRYLAHRRHGLK